MAEGGGLDDLGDEVGFDIEWQNTGICERCGSTSLHPTELGELICLDCGTQSQDVRQLVTEQLTEDAERASAMKGHKRRNKNKATEPRPDVRDAINTNDFVRALQHLLHENVKFLIEKFGADADLHAVVGSMWEMYLRRWCLSQVPMFHVIEGKFVSGGQSLYYAKLISDGMAPAGCIPPSVALIIAICYAGLRWIKSEYIPADLCRWVRHGDLRYLSAFSHLSEPLQTTLMVARAFFSPDTIPCAQAVYRLAVAFATNIGVKLPEPNVGLTLHHLTNVCYLPVTTTEFALRLFELDASDRRLGCAYYRVRHSSKGGAAVAQMDEIGKLRSKLDFASPAYAAALLFVGLRFHAEWEEWVMAHLQDSDVLDTVPVSADSLHNLKAGDVKLFTSILDQEVKPYDAIFFSSAEKVAVAEITDGDFAVALRGKFKQSGKVVSAEEHDPMMALLLGQPAASAVQQTPKSDSDNTTTVEVKFERLKALTQISRHDYTGIWSREQHRSLTTFSEALRVLSTALVKEKCPLDLALSTAEVEKEAALPLVGHFNIYPKNRKGTLTGINSRPSLQEYPKQYLRLLRHICRACDLGSEEILSFVDTLELLILLYLPVREVEGHNLFSTHRKVRARTTETVLGRSEDADKMPTEPSTKESRHESLTALLDEGGLPA